MGSLILKHEDTIHTQNTIFFCVCAFVNAGKRGLTLVNEQVNVDTPPNVDVRGFLLCPGDQK